MTRAILGNEDGAARREECCGLSLRLPGRWFLFGRHQKRLGNRRLHWRGAAGRNDIFDSAFARWVDSRRHLDGSFGRALCGNLVRWLLGSSGDILYWLFCGLGVRSGDAL
ncbi:MAG: hypothetical protein ACI9EF_001512 [Pseudohongiellaceae bacterium]|jgi:hypothetical protein